MRCNFTPLPGNRLTILRNEKMAGKGGSGIRFDEDFLVSDEKLDRNSPLLWSENSLFGELSPVILPHTSEVPQWSAESLNKDNSEEKLLQELSLLNDSELKEKVQILKKLSYQLEQEEAKEIQRTKCLNIFGDQ